MNNEVKTFTTGSLRNGDFIAHRGQVRKIQQISSVEGGGSRLEFVDAPELWLNEGDEIEVPYSGLPTGDSDE